jgi:adhesin HecA-like repeat protein
MFAPFVMVCSLAILVIVLALRLRLLTAVNSGTITSQDDTNITASNITNQNGIMTGNKLLTIVPLLLMVMFCALKKAWGVLLKSSSVALAK